MRKQASTERYKTMPVVIKLSATEIESITNKTVKRSSGSRKAAQAENAALLASLTPNEPALVELSEGEDRNKVKRGLLFAAKRAGVELVIRATTKTQAIKLGKAGFIVSIAQNQEESTATVAKPRRNRKS
jgi:hypothetical protein